ncbi:MAG: hypothetical protein R3D98_08795 [Candidatus Krumholzibacteriia bacterium]
MGRLPGAMLVVLAAAPALAQTPADTTLADVDLAAALDEVAAAGGVADPAELPAMDPFWRWPSGEMMVDVRGGAAGVERTRGGVELEARPVRLAGRWQRTDAGTAVAGWFVADRGGWSAGMGHGGLQHGVGLVSAAPGGRSSLDAGSSLLAPRQGWRGTLSEASTGGWQAIWARGERGPLAVLAADGRDQDGRPVSLQRLAWSGRGIDLAVLRTRRDGRRATSLSFLQAGHGWRVVGEAAAWSGHGSAAVVTAMVDQGAWRGELQVALSRVTASPAGGLRPATLLGWRGRGWTLRWQRKVRHAVVLEGLVTWSRARDLDAAAADERERLRADLIWSGALPGRGRWHLRGRLDQERQWRWQAAEPWSPPAVMAVMPRWWLTAGGDLPLAGGELRLSWRLSQKDRQARHLLSGQWSADHGAIRLRAGWQTAWGPPVDLVSLSVPVPGFYVVQHWGDWRSGAWLGLAGRGRWGWQLAVVARRPTARNQPAEVTGQAGLRLGL